MNKQSKVLISMLVVLLIALIVACVVNVMKRQTPSKTTVLENVSSGQMATLKDGGQLELKVASYGTHYIYAEPPHPGWMHYTSCCEGFKADGPLAALTLGYYYYPPKSASKSVGYLSPTISEVVLTDDAGSLFLLHPARTAYASSLESTKAVYAEEARVFPRRGNTLTAKVYCDDHQHPDAEFTFPNPFPVSMRNFPVWKPERLPVRQTSGDMTMTAEKFTSSSHEEMKRKQKERKSEFRSRYYGPHRVFSKIKVNLRSIGKTPCSYTILSADLSDPTGNILKSSYLDQPASDKSVSPALCFFDNNFGGNEPVVKLKLTFARQNGSAIPPKDLVQVTGLKPFSNISKGEINEINKKQTGTLKHLVLAGVPIDICVLQQGYFQVIPTLTFLSRSNCVALILPENTTTIKPRITIRNEKGKILAPDKSYENQITYQTYTLKAYVGFLHINTDEWQDYEDSPKMSSFTPPVYRCTDKGSPQVLIYGLPSIKPDDVLNISIDTNPVRTFEFTLPMPAAIMNHGK